MKRQLLREALKVANSKLARHPQKVWLHYSFIVQGNRIIEWATNVSGTPPVHYGFNQRFMDTGYKPKLHSEIMAYRRAKGLLDKSWFEVINIRLNRAGIVRLSKPCPVCYGILTELGCRAFYYSSEVGFLRVS